MTEQNLDKLSDQAWNLRVKLNKIIEDGVGNSIPSVRRERLNHAHARAYDRFLRRQDAQYDAPSMR